MRFINVALDAYNILICLILFVSMYFRHYINQNIRRWYKIMVMANIILSAADICTMFFEGSAHAYNFKILPIAMFIFYIMSYGILIASGVEIMFILNQTKYKKHFLIITIVCSIFFFLFIFITPFTGFLYTFDENNIYSRGYYFPIVVALQIVLYLNLLSFIVLNRKSLSLKKMGKLLYFLFFPIVLQFVQLLVYGISLINSGYTMAFIILYIQSNQTLEETLDFTEEELGAKESELNSKLSEIENSKLQVIKMQNHTIESLSNLVENRDEDTGEHVRRTRSYVELLAVQLMKNNHFPDILTPRYIRFLKRAAPMHDIGKIVVPDAILKKPGRLTEQEFELIKRHAEEGGRIVHEILDGYEDPEYIQITADIAKHHHEKWNGTGYPDHLKGNDIPLSARIMAIADVFDALVSPRIYKSPMTYEEAYEIIESGIGVHFDPIVAQEFLNIKEKTAAINESFKTTN